VVKELDTSLKFRLWVQIPPFASARVAQSGRAEFEKPVLNYPLKTI